MANIPNQVHFVYGLRDQKECFPLLYYLAIESCRRRQAPDHIYLHYHHLPCGVYWDMIRPHLTLVRVDPVQSVLDAEYSEHAIGDRYRYAHHADFVRLDALLEHGGIYADIDTLFLRPLPQELFEKPFVIGREADLEDPITGAKKPSLCNAFLMAPPGAHFTHVWRQRMPEAFDGSWSNHSCLLPQQLSQELPADVHIEPIESFYSLPYRPEALEGFLSGKGSAPDLSSAYSIHLWAHLWWNCDRSDFSTVSGEDLTLERLSCMNSPLAQLVHELLPVLDVDDIPAT